MLGRGVGGGGRLMFLAAPEYVAKPLPDMSQPSGPQKSLGLNWPSQDRIEELREL